MGRHVLVPHGGERATHPQHVVPGPGHGEHSRRAGCDRAAPHHGDHSDLASHHHRVQSCRWPVSSRRRSSCS
jgi:hypothetical protein